MNSMIRTWSKDATSYALSDQFSLLKAEAKDWNIYYSVYYNQAYNGFFKEYGYEVHDSDHLFWIFRGESKVGGVIVSENTMSNLFFIPPFNDELKLVKLLKQLLIDFSDGSRDILVFDVLPPQVDLFARAGFWIGAERSRWMQRPTEVIDIEWDDDLRIEKPRRLANELDIAEAMFESFKGGVNAARRNHTSRESYIFDLQHPIFTDTMVNASTLVYDKATNKLVGVCLLFMADQRRTFYPGLYIFGVHPSYRKRGIASNMLKRALTELHGEYPIMRLGLLQGTYAESVYYNLGFMPADVEVEVCVLPTSEINLLKSP